MKRAHTLVLALPSLIAIGVGCSGDKKKKVNDEATVIEIYEAFVPTILKLTSAGLAAKDSASGATINPYNFTGDVSGTGVITGTVAQAGGGNENLSLDVDLTNYADTDAMTFATETSALQFDYQIKSQPADNQIQSGILDGELSVSGENVDGTALFDLALTVDMNDDDGDPFLICSHVTGTVTVGDDAEPIDFVLVHLDTALDPAQQTKCEGL